MNKELLNSLYTIQDGLGNIYLASFVKTDEGVEWIAHYSVYDFGTNWETHNPLIGRFGSGFGGFKVLQNNITRLRCPKIKKGRRSGCLILKCK